MVAIAYYFDVASYRYFDYSCTKFNNISVYIRTFLDDKMKQMKEFYEFNPFPDYDLDNSDIYDLQYSKSPFLHNLKRFIPDDAEILDVGCGTGQLTIFLAFWKKKVTGIDFSKSSISKARKLKKKFGVENVTFINTDLFDYNTNKKFDYIFCMGVLHHTENPKLGFQKLCKMLKKDGYIIIGLYNKYSRFPFRIKRLFFNKRKFKNEKERSWYLDQYKNPYESFHSVGEVLSWFKENNIEFINSAPELDFFNSDFLFNFHSIFDKKKINLNSSYILHQLKWMFTTREKGYFLMVGRK